jgi:predicted dehydrogenase
MHRRTFLGAALAQSPLLGANDRIRAGVIGSGGRGRLLIAEFKELGVEVAAVADVYEPNLAAGVAAASTGAKPYANYRRMLEDKALDAVVVATPDHWHAQMTIDAVEAGKDVYVEKPLAHTIADGYRMIEAVRRTKRVVQVGTQRRSYDLYQEAAGIVHSGVLGDVRLVNSWWVNHTASLGERELKGKLDWNEWLGPAPKRALDTKRFFGWYYFWDYSGGLMIGQAAHVMDAIHWFMKSEQPAAVTCSAARPNIPGAEVPETTCMSIEYPENYLAVFTLGYQAMRYHTHNDQMNQYHGSKARLDVGRESYALYPEQRGLEVKPSQEKRAPNTFVPATRAHIRNFMECVRSRKDPNATVEMGQSTNIVLCMAMDALRAGRRLEWDPQRRAVKRA